MVHHGGSSAFEELSQMKLLKKLGLLMVVGAIALACSSNDEEPTHNDPPGDGNGDAFDRSAMLANWADNIIMPGYSDFQTSLTVLKVAVDEFNEAPDANKLSTLRNSWYSTYLTWQRISMFETGPAESANYRLNINIYPTDPSLIESNIANGSYNLALSSNRVAKGLPAMDYLLHGSGVNDGAIINLFANNAAYRTYLTDITVDMIELTDQVAAAWSDGYRDTFVNNDGASSTASVDRMVNDYIYYFEKFLRAGKMGIPLGVFSGSVLNGNLEAYHEGTKANELFLEGLDAVQDFFNGRHYSGNGSGESLASYLNELNAVSDGENLSSLINAQINSARSQVTGLDLFANELEKAPPTPMLEAYDEVQKVVPLMKVDMVSAMSISIDFVDADGD